jgi:hypothetical protein
MQTSLLVILVTSVEGATPVVGLVQLSIIKFNKFPLNVKLKEPSKHVNRNHTVKGSHDPEKL